MYAEDPSNGFLPSPGIIDSLPCPPGPASVTTAAPTPGCNISSFYDPLISKLSVWAPTRERAVARMRRALSEYVVTGIRTNLAFHEKLFAHPEFVAGSYDTGFIERYRDVLLGYPRVAAGGERRRGCRGDCGVAHRAGDGGEGARQGETGSRLSPWVAQHRAGLRSR